MRKKRVQITIAAVLTGSTLLIGGCSSPDVSQVNAETAVVETKEVQTVKEIETTEEPETVTETQTAEPETTTESETAIEPETATEPETTEPETVTEESNNLEKLDIVMYATADLNVRDKANTEGEKIGSLGYGEKVQVVSRDKNTGWYQIEYQGGLGFVSDDYLSDTKPAPKPAPSSNKGSSGQSNQNSGGGGTQSKPSQAPTPAPAPTPKPAPSGGGNGNKNNGGTVKDGESGSEISWEEIKDDALERLEESWK